MSAVLYSKHTWQKKGTCVYKGLSSHRIKNLLLCSKCLAAPIVRHLPPRRMHGDHIISDPLVALRASVIMISSIIRITVYSRFRITHILVSVTRTLRALSATCLASTSSFLAFHTSLTTLPIVPPSPLPRRDLDGSSTSKRNAWTEEVGTSGGSKERTAVLSI